MINLIAAVGTKGEIGYHGRIPWLSDPNIQNTLREDLGWFARQTAGGVIVVGTRTYNEMLTMGFVPGSRDVWRWNGRHPVGAFLAELEEAHPHRDVWVCGGAWTYQAFMPYIQRFHISRIPWTGPADAFLPPILGNWEYRDPDLLEHYGPDGEIIGYVRRS